MDHVEVGTESITLTDSSVHVTPVLLYLDKDGSSATKKIAT